MTINCFQQLSNNEQILEIYRELTEDKTTTFGQVAADTAIADVIPVTAKAWSISVVGANATITVNGVAQAVATGHSFSGVGPLANPIRITTGATTTVAWSYAS